MCGSVGDGVIGRVGAWVGSPCRCSAAGKAVTGGKGCDDDSSVGWQGPALLFGTLMHGQLTGWAAPSLLAVAWS
jgi:hypothetical protein